MAGGQLWLLVTYLTCSLVFAEDFVKPKVTRIEPNEGSYAGATRLYITGEGFSSSGNFNSAAGAATLGNKAYLVSDFETVPCDVENDASHERMIVCYTRPMMRDQYYYIQVEVDGYMVPMEENCNRWYRGSKCRFLTRWYRTPYLSNCYVTPEVGEEFPMQTASPPGSLITCWGRLFTAIYGSNNQTNENGRTVSIRRAYSGGKTCELLREPDVPYDLRLTNGDDGTFTCKPTGTYVGGHNVSLILTDGFGRTDIDHKLKKTNSKDKVYNFQTYAEITSVWPEVGSMEGGTHVNIYGRNFDATDEPVQVFIGRVPCVIIPGTLTDEKVECIAGNPPEEEDFYPGSRGVMMEAWNETTAGNSDVLDFVQNTTNYEGSVVIDSAGWRWNTAKDNFVVKQTGIFVAPKTDKYKFKIAADDHASLYINCEGERENLTRVAYTDRPVSTYHYHFQSSDWISLNKGQECYLVSTFREYGGTAYLYVGVQRATTKLTYTQSVEAQNEKQNVDFTASYLREKQVINFTSWSNEAGTAEEQLLTVKHTCISSGSCDQVGYRLVYEGVKTIFIKADASSSTVRNALKYIYELSDEDVAVSDSRSSNTITYTVQFKKKRGDYSALSFEKYPASVTGLTISVSEKTKGEAARTTFRLRLGDRATDAIPQNADAEEIQQALDGTRNAFCPDFLLPDKRQSTVVTTYDYETQKYGSEWGSRQTNVECFCGRTCILNSEYIYHAGRTADNPDTRHGSFDASQNKWLCLAHKGPMYHELHLNGVFKGEGTQRSGNYAFTNPLQTHDTEWRYSCIDLMELINSRSDFAFATEVTLNVIRFLRKGRGFAYYLDALTIGSSKTTDDFDGVLNIRTPPALASGHPISKITVKKIQDSQAFEVEIDTYNCGDDIPLISLAFTSIATASSDEIVQRESSWPVETSFISKRLVAGVKPMAGSFDLTINFPDGHSHILSDVPVDVGGEKFAEKLSGVPGFGAAKVSVHGSCHAKDYLVEWLTNGGDKPLMEVEMSKVSGASDIKASVTTWQDGGIMHHPVTGDMMRLVYETPQVEVFINGYASKCVGNCEFDTSEEATPIISSISPTSGSTDIGTSITITGMKLDALSSSTSMIKIGEAMCDITSNTATNIICDLGAGPLGTHDVTVNVGGKGLARKETVNVSTSFTISGGIESITPSTGFSSGGTKVKISGYGFSKMTVFKFANTACLVLSWTSKEITCVTPKSTSGAVSVTVTATDGSENLGTTSFIYTNPDATITTTSPTKSLLSGGQNLTITGTNLNQNDVTVKIGEYECSVLTASDSQIICALPSAPRGVYDVLVHIPGKGYALGSRTVNYKLEVISISPSVGSINGGTEITITGDGFGDADDTEVKLSGSKCEIESITSQKIECTMGRATKVYTITNGGRHASLGPGFDWEPKDLSIEIGDTVVFKWEINGASGGWSYGARVFTVSSPDSDDFDGKGFQSSPDKSEKGTFSYTFTNDGTYYVSSGRVDHPDWGSVIMRATIVVIENQAKRNYLMVTVGGHDAVYQPAIPVRKKRSTCSGSVNVVSGCTPTSLSGSADFSVATDTCYTPKITSISPMEGTSDTTITIEGQGFSSENCANKVIIGAGYDGEYQCTIFSSTLTKIKCKASPVASTPMNTAFYVKVNVDDIGDTTSLVLLDSDRRFTLLPSFKSVSPSTGSLAGETLLTISGDGFSTDISAMTVLIGSFTCQITEATYFEIKCLTPSSASEGTQEVKVMINGQESECTNTCQFTYDGSKTPTVTSVTPTTIDTENTEVVFGGTAFSGDESKVSVMIGEFTCSVTASTSTSIKCDISYLPAGSHTLSISVADKGKAKFDSVSSYITSPAVITSMSPVNGSKFGGTEITFQGNGFKSDDLYVKIGKVCEIKGMVTNNMFKCTTYSGQKQSGMKTVTITSNGQTYPSQSFDFKSSLTPEITSISPTTGEAGEVVQLTGEMFIPGDMEVKIGDAVCTGVSGNDTHITCVVGQHAGGEYAVSANIGEMGFAESNVMFNYTFAITGVNPATGSYAGGDLITILGKGFSSRAEVMICDSMCEHGLDVPNSEAIGTMIKCKVANSSGDLSSDKICDITISVDGQEVVGENLYTFAADHTPQVTGISPPRGGTQGGTIVTITGTRFDNDHSKISVKIGGVVCDVSASTETEITCTTNSRGHSIKDKVEVTITGKGMAINDDVEFYYVDVWSSKWTWGGQDPPVQGDFVVVPSGQTLVIDVDTPILKMLLIQGGVVIFDEKDIHMQAENILITDGGVLQVGTEEEPFQHKGIITLHGNLRSRELPIYGTKTLGVRNGTLDLHGRYVPITWTLLSETAAAGSKTLKLQQAVTWQVGDEIVIASTGHRHSQKENEKAEIAAVSGDHTTLTLVEELQYTHISATETFDGVTLETHGEVGLLTRNVVVQGSRHAEWEEDVIPACEEGFNTGEFVTQTCFQGRFGEEEGSDQFGAQIMIHHRSPNLDIARARIEYVELTQVGQAFRLGRYPIHFHLLGDVHFNNYVRGCAIHKSFNRAITIHNTHHLLIENNVVYDIMGGAVFIEDGIEHGNKIQYNLVVFCKQSTSLQNDDITPAAFWVTNPNNTLQHNAAAGGTHFGFWYRIHATPDGPSADPNICQQLHPIEMFQNNTVHSQGWFGLWVFEKYTPKGDGSCGSTEPNVVVYDSFTVWNCEKGAELVNVGAIQFRRFIMAHNEKAGIETKLVVDKQVKWGQVGTYDSFIIARATGLTEGGSTAVGIILPFTEGYEVNNTKFINFDENRSSAIGVTSIDGTCSVLCGGWEARFSQISFQNSPNKAKFRWEHEVILRDRDGTLSGTNKHSVITPYNPTISSTACPEIAAFSLGAVKGVICDGSVKFHRVSWNNVLPTSLEAKDVSYTTDFGSSFIPFAKKRLTHKFGWMGTMMDGETYKWTFENAGHLTNISYSSGFYNFEEDDCVIVSHNLTQKPDKFVIAGINEEYEQDDMVNCQNNYHGDYYFDAVTKNLFYIVSGRDRSFRKKRESATPGAVNRHINFKVYRCYYLDCLPPPDPNTQPPVRERPEVVQIWHDETYWKMNDDGEYVGAAVGDGSTTIPPTDQDIRIEAGAWMIVKQDLPQIKKLWIEGVLELDWEDENLEVTLSATHIIIMGGRLIVGWEDALFRGMASIVLRGDHNTEDLLLNGGINLGAKAIGVIGGLDLHGRERALRTTHLASTLAKGSDTLTLMDLPSDWIPGDEIVIATTSADPWETETFSITAVNDKTVTLNATAAFDHIAETITYNDGTSKTYNLRAEVTLLTRNIKIIGKDYPDLFKESFGARILVAGAGGARGYARIQNVEFYHTGQEGWIDNFDPRYSLAFLNTEQVDVIKPSFVKRNTFHNGFNTAIGVFGATGLEVVENAIHHTVGPGIRVEGTGITLKENLVMLARTRSVYQDRFEDDLLLWKAAIEVNLAESPILIDNVVVGSERGGFRIDGHNCDPDAEASIIEWGWNTARATLHGIWMNKDGFSVCSHISKFRIHAAYDNGIYYQGSGNIKISDVLVTDSTFGIAPIVYSPASLSHVYRDKSVTIENSVIVAVSKQDYCPTLSSQTDYVKNSNLARGIKRTGANEFARAGILWPIFISGQNAAPSKPFVGSMSYPAIGGKSTISNVTFVNFGDTSCSQHHTAILTNLKVEDFLHPIRTSKLHFDNTPEKTRVFFHRPSIGAINPSDCVDMECDGMKKALIVDEDGSLLGEPGTVIPQAEFEWDGDRRRGLGDYRIPKTLLTALNGDRIPVNELVPNKGILRANTSDTTCTTMDIWQGHACTGYHHGILVIENLDADTETRRLSPVALAAEKYIDLNNGPQDHGWCAGYTCQERLSTFWTIVAFTKSYELHFSGTAPEKLRLRILNEEPSTKMVLRIFYTRPQRLDVYVGQNYQSPLNHGFDENGNDIILAPITFDQYYPTIHNFSGDNYHDRKSSLLHVTIGGNSVVEIREAPVVVITFNLPAVSPDEFFDNGKLVENLALFLEIPASKIRLVDAIREGSTSRRRKREVGSYEATVMIGDPPATTIDSTDSTTSTQAPGATEPTPTSNSTTLDELARTTARITNALQENRLADALGTDVASLNVVDPRPPAERNANITNSTEPDDGDGSVSYFVPTGLRVITQPSSGNAQSPLSPTITVTGVDNDNNDIVLGHKGDQWQATVTIQNGVNEAVMSGTTIAKFEEGIATFEDLALSLPGSYVLKITVTYPETQSGLTAITDPFTLQNAVVTTAEQTTSVKVDPIPPESPGNLAVIIACSVVGGLLLIAVVVVLVLKGPCATRSYKVSNEEMRMSNVPNDGNAPPRYEEIGRPPSQRSSFPPAQTEEPTLPHSVIEEPKDPYAEIDDKKLGKETTF